MQNEAQFLKAIVAHPDSDAPRLLFADWLEEHGDFERAEFIRLQFEIEDHPKWSPYRMDLEARADALLDRHREKWLEDVPAWGSQTLYEDAWPHRDVSFRKGFLDSARVNVGNFFISSAELFSTAPLQRAQIESIWDVEMLAQYPAMSRLKHVALRFYPDESFDLLPLFESPYLAEVESLRILASGIRNGGLRAIAECAGLARLKSLALVGCGSGPYGIRALAESPLLSELEELEIESSSLPGEGLARLAGTPLAARLTSLRLSHCAGVRGLLALLQAQAPQLRRLSLTGSSDLLADEGARALAQFDALSKLEALRLCARLDYNGTRGLADSPVLLGLRELDLSSCKLDDDQVMELARSPYLRNLRYLNLGDNHIGPLGVESLVRSPILATVTHLSLRGNFLGDAGAETLAGGENLGELRQLNLDVTGIGIDGVQAICESPQLPRLREIYVMGAHFASQGSRALLDQSLDTKGYSELAWRVSHHGLSSDAEQLLHQRFGQSLYSRAGWYDASYTGGEGDVFETPP